VAAILVGECDCRKQFWKRTIQWLFHQSLVLIELLVPDKMVFMWILKIFLSETICSIRTKFEWNSHWMVLFQKCVRQFGPSTKMIPTAFWKRTIQWLFHQSLVLIELLVPDKMVFMWISHRVQRYVVNFHI
jgi:hypothetical protein